MPFFFFTQILMVHFRDIYKITFIIENLCMIQLVFLSIPLPFSDFSFPFLSLSTSLSLGSPIHLNIFLLFQSTCYTFWSLLTPKKQCSLYTCVFDLCHVYVWSRCIHFPRNICSLPFLMQSSTPL